MRPQFSSGRDLCLYHSQDLLSSDSKSLLLIGVVLSHSEDFYIQTVSQLRLFRILTGVYLLLSLFQ